jgi:hypothetical protein
VGLEHLAQSGSDLGQEETHAYVCIPLGPLLLQSRTGSSWGPVGAASKAEGLAHSGRFLVSWWRGEGPPLPLPMATAWAARLSSLAGQAQDQKILIKKQKEETDGRHSSYLNRASTGGCPPSTPSQMGLCPRNIGLYLFLSLPWLITKPK